jgi:hypothetical protein
MSTDTALPDLLRRFVATPHRCRAVAQSMIITIETNDQEMLAALRDRAEQLIGVLRSSSDSAWHWKLVRDHDFSQSTFEAHLLSGDALSTLFLGTGTIVAIDWIRGELLGFVAANLPAQQLLDILLDLARRGHLHPGNGTTAGSLSTSNRGDVHGRSASTPPSNPSENIKAVHK